MRKRYYYKILNLFLLLSLVFSSGMSVRAQEEKGSTESAQEAAAGENLPKETPETAGGEESETVDEENPETVNEDNSKTALEEKPEASGGEEPEAEDKEDSVDEGESEALEEEGNPPLNYVPAEELLPGSSYALAYEEEGSFTLLGAKGKELYTTSLPALNEETVSGKVWHLEGEYGVYSIRTEDETGTSYWLYLNENGWHLSAEETWGWERNGDYLQYTDDDDRIYGLFSDDHAFVLYLPEGSEGSYTVFESPEVSRKDEGQEGTHYLAFASDKHDNTDAIRESMQSMPVPEYINFIGDMVGHGRDMMPSYRYTDIYNEVHAVFPSLTQSQVAITWASHDEHVIDDSEEGVTGVLAREEGSSGPVYTGVDEEGNPMFYVYAIAFYDMRNGSPEPAGKFRAWAKSLPAGIPVIAVCHIPINANRSDNRSAWYWHDALNYVASEGGEETIRDVIFLHGHNHTTERNREYFYPVGTSIQVPSPGKSDRTGIDSVIRYTYITAGYLNANDTATLIGISDTQITMKKYWGRTPGDNVMVFDETIERTIPEVPRLSLSETSLVLEAGREGAFLRAQAKNTGTKARIFWESDHPEIASVYEGMVKPKAEGKAVITASMTIGETAYSASCTVIVNKQKIRPSGNAFVLTDHFEDGQEYLILNSDQKGSGTALKNDDGTPSTASLEIRSDPLNGTYVLRKDTDDSMVWTSEETETEAYLLKCGSYLSLGRSGLTLTDGFMTRGLIYEDSLLSRQPSTPGPLLQSVSLEEEPTPPAPFPPVLANYYLVYDSETGTYISSENGEPVYIYGRKDIIEKKDHPSQPEDDKDDDDERPVSSASSSIPLTCQTAGYPQGYAWNEAAKACQMGFIDESGVFHAAKVTIPNTYDQGVTRHLFSFSGSLLVTAISLFLLGKYGNNRS